MAEAPESADPWRRGVQFGKGGLRVGGAELEQSFLENLLEIPLKSVPSLCARLGSAELGGAFK